MKRTDAPHAGAAGPTPVGDRVRIYLRGQVWYANFQSAGKQHRISLKTRSKKEARRRAIRLEAELDAGRFQRQPEPAPIAVAVTAYKAYLRTEQRARKTLDKYDKVLDRLAALAEQRNLRSMAALDLKLLDAYRAQRVTDGVQRKTIYTECVIIRQLVNFALSRDLLAVDPLKGLRLRKPKPTRQPCWTWHQVQTILAHSPEAVRPAFTLLAETGMRFSELAWLTWDDIDWANNVLHIRPKEGWQPKTGDQRSVPLSRLAQQVLHALPRRWPWVVTMPPSPTRPERGRQWSERRLLSALKRVLGRVQLPGKLHTFRHYFISNALLRGTPEATVRRWVGQVDPEVIKLYTHIHDSASQAAMQRLTEANRKELQREEPADEHQQGGTDSVQHQHTGKEDPNGPSAK
jgi:site-specific recombinase XerD